MNHIKFFAAICTLAIVCCAFITSTNFAASAVIDNTSFDVNLDVNEDGIIDENDINLVKSIIVSSSGGASVATLVKLEKYIHPLDYSLIAVNEENTNRIRNWVCVCDCSVNIHHACSGTLVDISSDTGAICRFVFSSGYTALPDDANVVVRHRNEYGVFYTIWEDGSNYYISEEELEDKEITEVRFDNPLLANWFYNCETKFLLREYENGSVGLSFEDAKSAYVLLFEEGLSEMPTSGVSTIIHRHWMPDTKQMLIIWASDDDMYHVSITNH